LLALISEMPPRLWWIAVQEVRNRHEDIQDARILIRTGDVGESVVQLKRISALQVSGTLEAKKLKVFGRGWANVWKVAEMAHLFSDDLCWVHGS